MLYDTDLTIEQQECADYITDSYTQMQVYVKTLIDLSTASTGYQLNKEIFNLPDYLKQVKVSIDALCRTKEIHLRMSMSDIPMQLTADKVLLGRAIQNVVNNALDYSPQDGTLHIDVCGKDNFVEISVTDEGKDFLTKRCSTRKNNSLWTTKAVIQRCTLVWAYILQNPLWNNIVVSLS